MAVVRGAAQRGRDWAKGRPLLSHPECAVCRKRRGKSAAHRARWRALGLCHQCGNPRQKYATCNDCRAYQAEVRALLRARKKEAA